DALQAGTEARVAGADYVFFNDGALEHLRAFVNQVYREARALLETAPGRG
ncbi:MAG: hypothetical protein H5T84_10755, partial [Thermoleophilia bacterium]|nr:hypothetical protein [Thermoleophilia bacterium]